MNLLDVIILSIVEGLTEFIPVSSTGHLILTQKLLKIPDSEFIKTFIISIQFGGIFSIVVKYYKKFLNITLYKLLFIAFLPSGIIGLLFGKLINNFLENEIIVLIALFIGGFFLLFIDKYKNPNAMSNVKYKNALIIGLFQCLSFIPGFSRSAATIIGGILSNLDKKTATEFSFFLAVPTIFLASLYKIFTNLFVNKLIFSYQEIIFLLIGNVISFIVAYIVISFFIKLVQKKVFFWFGIYRIILSVIFLAFVF